MQMERQEKMDYAAVVLEYRTNGGGLKMKEWCQQQVYDYFKVRRYSKKEPMFPGLETNAAVAAGTPQPPKLINLEMTVDPDSPSASSGGEDVLHVSEIVVRLSNSVEIRLCERPISEMVEMVNKLLC